ncbi:sigma-70 family RNA polymerase sigma factor [Hahella sp. SMD15-11]|uniref:Sigma-70 family RNA polymerase sigma factor n=1 Tax=Thermohahella caldifontis TaxID=3142973 RepID=A0AB39UUT9_9GAMM
MTGTTDDQDRALLRAMAAGDEKALKAFYRRHQQRIYAFALQRLGEPADAADVLNDVMLTVWHQADRFEGRSRVTTWLLGITHHRILDRIRSRKRQRWEALDEEPPDERPDPAWQQTTDDEYRKGLDTCLKALPAAQRDVVYLAFVEEHGYPDIARILTVPEGTIKTRMFHARKALKACLKRLGLMQ